MLGCCFFPLKQLDGPSVSSTPFFLLVNLNGVQAMQVTNGKRILLASLSYNEISELSHTEEHLLLSLGPKSYKFELSSSKHLVQFKDLVTTYLLELKEKAMLYYATESHKVSDPILLNFTKGAFIKVVPSDETTGNTGWSKARLLL